MNIKVTLIAGAAAAALIGSVAVAFVASAGAQDGGATPPAERQEKRERFLELLAARLGVDVATLDQAIKDARLDGVDEALAAGRIDEAQAVKARERINSGEGPGLGRFKERHQKHDRELKLRGALIENAATAIGVSKDELKSELKAGKSIAEVAAEAGVSIDDVKAQILSAATGKLNNAVANGRIDQAKADEALQKLTDSLEELLNKKRAAPPTP